MKSLFLIYCIVLVACNNSNSSATSNDSITTAIPDVQTDTTTVIVTPSCYAHQTSNNLVLLKLNMVSPTVSGELRYEIMGKDKNDGTITGTMRGDTLFADYTFMSEGKKSVRQVAFLRQGDAFIEGYAETQQKGDTVFFSKTDSLNFNGTMILQEIPCTQE